MEVLEHLLRQATAQTFRARCAGLDLTGLQEHFTGGETVGSGELVPAAALLGQLGTIPKLAELLGRLGGPEGEQSAEQAAAADRKSTRLNSSHANISYAVFCLKK